ncbi:hypothetical protein Aduo_006137 [Ancylostoma duodenale]
MNKANYPQAISCLKEKYGDDDVMVEGLLAGIHKSKARGRSIAAQTQLLEKISALMSQLAIKGENVDHRMLLNTTFNKFDLEIQANALQKRAELGNPKEWTWSRIRKGLQGVLERIQAQISSPSTQARKPFFRQHITSTACIYCKRANHSCMECRTVPEHERDAFLAENKLCQNCSKPNHSAEVCKNQTFGFLRTSAGWFVHNVKNV